MEKNVGNNRLSKADHERWVLKTRQGKERENAGNKRKRERIEAEKAAERARKKAEKAGNEGAMYLLSLRRGRGR